MSLINSFEHSIKIGKTRKRTIGDEEKSYLAMSSSSENEYDLGRRDSDDLSYVYASSRTSRDVSNGSREAMVPGSPPMKRIRERSHYLYRIPNRTMRWLCVALMATILLFILHLARMSMNSAEALELLKKARISPPATWESFPFLTRYFGGLRTLTSRSQSIREFPTDNITLIETKVTRDTLESEPYDMFSEYKKSHSDAVECFLDNKAQLPIPKIHNYKGVPQGMPEPAYGSSSVLNLSEEYCFDRYGRLGPYGFGYSSPKGGIGAGIEGERENANTVWAAQSAINYSNISWHKTQVVCLEKNKHRFAPIAPTAPDAWKDTLVKREGMTSNNTIHRTVPKTAFIIRTWSDYNYTPEAKLYLRSLISELALTSGGEYTVHFLIHVKNDNEPIWADPDTYDRIQRHSLPEEFRGMGTLWSERQMNLIYGGLHDTFYRDRHVHGVYRSAHFPLQWFAHQHPEYEYFWNWEMDTRYTGHWLTLFEKARAWAKEQPRKGLWERNERFYVPEVHGTWEDFKQMVRVQSEMPVQATTNKWANVGPPGSPQTSNQIDKPIWGPRSPSLGFTAFETDPIPPTTYERDKYTWGVGEEADLITFNPIFDPDRTDWILREDVTSYDLKQGFPPRRTSVVASSRLSRRLLTTMHNETVFHGHTMFTEMFPASMALHHGLKAAYAPNPVYIDRKWPIKYLVKVLNAGKNGAVGGARTTVFGDIMQHNLRGVSWHYNTGFAPNLWRRWLGYRVDNDGGEEFEINNEGRMCLPPILLHPIEEVDLVIEDAIGEEQT